MMKFQLSNSKLLLQISRYLLALLFVFSGLAKGLNPFGLSIQFSEYFNVLGISFLAPLSWFFAILLPAVEALLGLALLFGLAKWLSAWGVILFMGFFTILTFWIALTNPVNDCGCFGDLLKISNTATFIKNIVFMLPALILFIHRNDKTSTVNYRALKWCFALFVSLILPIYTTFALPLIDATPFRVGVNILDDMAVPDGAIQPVRQTVLLYRDLQSGDVKEFSIEDTTWHDATRWEFIESRTEELTAGYMPPIAAFPMLNVAGEDVAQQLLSVPDLYVFAVTDLRDIDFEQFMALSSNGKTRFVVLTSASLADVPQGVECYNSDYSLIRTIIQYPKGGVVQLRNATIINKWAMPNFKFMLNNQ